MVNRPLYIPAGVSLVRHDEANDRPVLVCEGRCRPSWTTHARGGVAMLDNGGRAAPRYVCEECQTSRRWGT